MALGFFLIEVDAPLARYLRLEFDRYWTIAEIFLFVLLGAAIDLQILGGILLPGLLLLGIGLLVGRMIGWFLSTLGSNWNWRERLFLLPANMPRATVQAAIGGMPLAMGLEGGEIFLAVAALSILVTAPLGAWGTVLLAPKLLKKGPIDATKVTAAQMPVIMAAVNTSPMATDILLKTAELARRNRAKVIALHVDNKGNRKEIEKLSDLVIKHLADIRHDFLVINGSVPGEILRVSEEYQVSEIVIGRRGRQRVRNALLGSVSEAVIEASTIPIVLVENNYHEDSPAP
jgi:solute carrier family 9B (sodium/hydrogen exchanger), member 1/2